jgi:hypothetical protein
LPVTTAQGMRRRVAGMLRRTMVKRRVRDASMNG